MFGDRVAKPTVVPEPLDGLTLDLEGHELQIVEVGQGDIRPSTVVHIPALEAVVSGSRPGSACALCPRRRSPAGRQ